MERGGVGDARVANAFQIGDIITFEFFRDDDFRRLAFGQRSLRGRQGGTRLSLFRIVFVFERGGFGLPSSQVLVSGQASPQLRRQSFSSSSQRSAL